MKGGQSLLTLVHVSDLHVGLPDPSGSGNAQAHPLFGQAMVQLPYLDGLLGHHGESLRSIVEFLRRLPRQPTVPQRLLVSGDLTRCGAAQELHLADSYLHQRVNLGTASAPLMTGLRARRSDVKLIPGNHDQWGGLPVPLSGAPSSYPAASLAQMLPRLETLPLAGGLQLVLAQVDSDADIHRLSTARFLAQGAFLSQLRALGPLLGKPRKDELRVMAVHHSYSRRGRTLRMQPHVRDALRQFMQDHGVQLLLSGHTHVCDHHEIRDDQNQLVGHELCCGSTSQLDHLPPSWQKIKTPASWQWRTPNSLFVHELLALKNGRLRWRARPHYRHPVKGFTDDKLVPFDLDL